MSYISKLSRVKRPYIPKVFFFCHDKNKKIKIFQTDVTIMRIGIGPRLGFIGELTGEKLEALEVVLSFEYLLERCLLTCEKEGEGSVEALEMIDIVSCFLDCEDRLRIFFLVGDDCESINLLRSVVFRLPTLSKLFESGASAYYRHTKHIRWQIRNMHFQKKLDNQQPTRSLLRSRRVLSCPTVSRYSALTTTQPAEISRVLFDHIPHSRDRALGPSISFLMVGPCRLTISYFTHNKLTSLSTITTAPTAKTLISVTMRSIAKITEEFFDRPSFFSYYDSFLSFSSLTLNSLMSSVVSGFSFKSPSSLTKVRKDDVRSLSKSSELFAISSKKLSLVVFKKRLRSLKKRRLRREKAFRVLGRVYAGSLRLRCLSGFCFTTSLD